MENGRLSSSEEISAKGRLVQSLGEALRNLDELSAALGQFFSDDSETVRPKIAEARKVIRALADDVSRLGCRCDTNSADENIHRCGPR